MYQHDFIQNFDLGLFGPDTGMTSSQLQHGEGCQQLRQPQQLQLSLAERMQGDKQETLYSMSYDIKFNLEYESLEASSNLHEMMELDEVEEVKLEPEVKDENDHQALIDEVEQFLLQHETSVPTVDIPEQPLSTFEDCPLNSSFISDEDKIAAESLIDQLFCGSIAIDLDDQDQNFLDEFDATDDDVIAETSDVIDDSGFVDVSQLSGSEMVMADGTKVYFVVAPESPEASPISAASPESPTFAASPESPAFAASPESDESWSPESCPSSGRPRRKPTERKGGVRKAKSTIVDKKERKKHQNVEAARRYRDKKKNEQQLLDEELDELTQKNVDLKSKVSEKENELRTLKKLMIELGLIKVASRT